MSMIEIELGQKVKFVNHYVRHFVEPNTKVWTLEPFTREDVVHTGIIVGIRTLSNGTIEQSYDEPTIYTPHNYFKALLVVTDLRRKPLLVHYPKI